jgi:hypothetical protein
VNEPVQRLAALVVSAVTQSNPVAFGWIWPPLAVAGPIAAAAALHGRIELKFMAMSRRPVAAISTFSAAKEA